VQHEAECEPVPDGIPKPAAIAEFNELLYSTHSHLDLAHVGSGHSLKKTAPWSLSGEPRAANPDPVGKSPGMSYLAEAEIEWD
jgi:hypothetical protein